MNCKQVIKFPQNDEENDEIQEKMFEDLSLGHRLINSLRSGYKSKNLVVWKKVQEVTSLTANDRIEVSLKSTMPQWRYLNLSTSQHSNPPCPAILPRHLFQGMVFNVKDTMNSYAVSHSILEINANEKLLVVTEKLTFLPPGTRFISLVCKCMSWTSYYIETEDLEYEGYLCDDVREYLMSVCEEAVEPNLALIANIRMIFASYIETEVHHKTSTASSSASAAGTAAAIPSIESTFSSGLVPSQVKKSNNSKSTRKRR